MSRNQDWATKLFEYIDSKVDEPFSWGHNDCITFVAGAIEVMTGVNHLPDFPTYDSALSAARIIKENGGLDAMVGRYYPEIPVLLAQRGDVVYYPDAPNGPTVGIVTGPAACAPGETGIVLMQINTASKAWRI